MFSSPRSNEMYRVMRDTGSLQQFVSAWSDRAIPQDALIPAQEAARILMRVVSEKLSQSVAEKQIDVCVSHDLSLYPVRDRLLSESPDQGPVEFLDALLAFRRTIGFGSKCSDKPRRYHRELGPLGTSQKPGEFR
ncbi:MAG: hypothetical protein Ct9H300mP8_02220 [Gammaproteobacteria bacterium]|nr:MAG: hypothetical protein Ct9H300mP8_02220 [Gammaproteobacteria bacterium]